MHIYALDAIPSYMTIGSVLVETGMVGITLGHAIDIAYLP